MEFNYRFAGTDQVDASGVQDPNSGGSILYITPRLLVSVTRGMVARVSVQIPTWKGLNGEQTERAVYNAGLTYVF